MITLHRALILLSLLAVFVAAGMPLEQPYRATVLIDAPPVLLTLAAFGAVLVVVLQVVSAYGLFRFRRWAPTTAACATIGVVALALGLMLTPNFSSIVSLGAKLLAITSAIAWTMAALLARSTSMRTRYGIAL